LSSSFLQANHAPLFTLSFFNRDWILWKGRTGRSGRNGQYSVILSLEDYEVKALASSFGLESYQLVPHVPDAYNKNIIDNGIIGKVHNAAIARKLAANTFKIAVGEKLSTLCDSKCPFSFLLLSHKQLAHSPFFLLPFAPPIPHRLFLHFRRSI